MDLHAILFRTVIFVVLAQHPLGILHLLPIGSPCSSSSSCKCYWLATLVFIMLFLVVATTASSGGNITSGGIPLHLLAVLPEDQSHQMARAFRKATSDADSGLVEKEVSLAASSFIAPADSKKLIEDLCDLLQRKKPTAILSFVRASAAFYVSLAAGYVGIPVLAMSGGYVDGPAKDVNALYASLDPSPEELSHAVYILLKSNFWLHAIVIRDDSGFSKAFSRRLLTSLAADLPLPTASGQSALRSRELEVGRDYTDNQLFTAIGELLPRSHARVILVLCDRDTTSRVFAQASRANLLEDNRVWVVVEYAFEAEAPARTMPPGILGLKFRTRPLDRHNVRAAVEVFADAVEDLDFRTWGNQFGNYTMGMSCWFGSGDHRKKFASHIHRAVEQSISKHCNRTMARRGHQKGLLVPTSFDIYNLLPSSHSTRRRRRTDYVYQSGSEMNMPRYISRGIKARWRRIGSINSGVINLDTVLWLNADRLGPSTIGRQRFRVVTAFAPPFVMPATRVENGSCLLGVPCLQVKTASKEVLYSVFADYSSSRRQEGISYNISCCAGIAIDLMKNIGQDLAFDVDLYLVGDGYFGTRKGQRWTGMTADLLSGAAHLVFSAYSMTSSRSEVIDFSVPFYHSGVSCLTYTRERDVPLSAFLVPFSVQLWVAIFASLNATAVCAAIYEWLSPFGLNPWGRMRSKNFSLASALWVMWSLLFSHLVAFKAPKSWPNKVLINLWGCFSVIFVSSYTANIAAHFAGLFFHLRVDDFHDASLLHQRTGTAKSSAAEGYVFAENSELWQHIQNHGVNSMEEGLGKLRKGELDVLIGDTSILDYFRGNEPGCGLHLLGQSIFDDAYAVGMPKGFPLKKAISTLILRYESHGYVEQLQKKWFGRVPCFTHSVNHLNKPKPLSIGAVAGVFIMLVVGLGVGIVILVAEHMVFKHALPILRKKPPECFWKSPNLMFFSQKLYRFINTVELVSPHHSAKEIVSNLKEGQIFSLFQKSVKRKAKEEARRRKSKSQFFEMIQEIRKVVRTQQQQRRLPENFLDPNSRRNDSQPTHQSLLSPESPLGEDEHRLLLHAPASSSSPMSRHQRHEPKTLRKPLLGFGSQFHKYNHLPITLENSPSFAGKPTSVRNTTQYRTVLLSETSSDGSSEEIPNASISISVDDLRLNLNDSSYSPSNRRLGQTIRFLSVDDIHMWKHRKRAFGIRDLSNTNIKANYKNTPSSEKVAAPLCTDIDDLFLYSMSKEEILTSWRCSERKLLNTLRDALKEKKALEKKLAFIQKTLFKPP